MTSDEELIARMEDRATHLERAPAWNPELEQEAADLRALIALAKRPATEAREWSEGNVIAVVRAYLGRLHTPERVARVSDAELAPETVAMRAALSSLSPLGRECEDDTPWLREALRRYGDRVAMANAPAHLQEAIDRAMSLPPVSK